MKPLYLEGSPHTRVALDEPALVVARDGEADRLFPLQRLSRVISDTRVAWEQAALLALASNGIPLVFVDQQGQVAGRLLGQAGEPSSLVQQLEALLAQPDGVGRYHDWCEHQMREQLLALGRQYPGLGRLPDPDRMAARLASLLGERLEHTLLIGIDHLRSRIFAWVQEYLHHLGIGVQTPHLTGGIIDLAKDLTDILQWRVVMRWVVLVLRYPALRRTALDGYRQERRITEFYQRFEADLDRAGRTLLSRLHLWTATRDCQT